MTGVLRVMRSSSAHLYERVEAGAARVLVVDADARERRTLARQLELRGMQVEQAGEVDEATAALAGGGYSLLVCDHCSPGVRNTDLVARALKIDPELAIVVLAGLDDAATVAELLNRGVFDFVRKPADPLQLVTAMDRALERRRREMERRRLERAVRETVILRTVQIEKERAALRNLSIEIVQSLVRVLEAKDPFLRGHSERVALLAGRIAEEMRLSRDQVETVKLAARIHDVGMVGIPERILSKPGPLTAEEFEVVKTHVDIGLTILTPIRSIGDALLYVRDHHEQFDGSGYPRGISGESISIGGRILAAADAYDALTSSRAFRRAHSGAETLGILRRQIRRRFDPEVCEALEAVVRVEPAYTLL